jgi:polyether ionophore transport system permease protein
MTVQAPPAARAGQAGSGRASSGLAGTGALTKLAFRRDRIMLAGWVYLILVMVASNAYTFKKLYSTAAARANLVLSGGGNPALRFLYGQLNGSSVGALTAWRIGVWSALFCALMTIFIVIRHTRADEEAGRLELLGSAVVGRQAALTAGLLTAVTASVAVAVLLSVVLPAVGLPVSGSVAFALAVGANGLAFTGIAAVAAQLASGARAARGVAFAVLGAAFMLRAIGDSAGPSGPSWLTWTSPLGWVELTRPFDGQRWWVLALPCAVLAAGVGAAYALAARRDLGAGLLPDRPGRASASGLLRGPLSLAFRLQRGVLAGWAAGVAFIFAASGAAAKGIGQLLGSSTALQREFTRLGGQAAITNAYLAALMLLAGLGAAGYATSAVLRLRAEETDGLAEPLLATAAGRIRWGLSHLAVAVFGAAVLLAVAGLAAGLGYGLRTGSDPSPGPQAARMIGAAMAQLPASLVIAGVAVALVGLLPGGCVAGAWTVLGVVVFIDLFGEALQLSHWLLDISPFTHAPRLPGGTVSAAPLLWLCLAALAFSAVGLAALRRRDIG